jgi:hypothetical protein
MNKIILGIVGVVVIGSVGFVLLNLGGEKTVLSNECIKICADANSVCPSLINKQTCEANCSKFSQETKDHLKNSTSCEEIAKKPELISDVIISNTAKPEEKVTSNDCELACVNYVNKCLTLVPNADQALFNEGLSSCITECANYSADKVNCLISAIDCPAMTEQCGL